jgi:hypothetical protein
MGVDAVSTIFSKLVEARLIYTQIYGDPDFLVMDHRDLPRAEADAEHAYGCIHGEVLKPRHTVENAAAGLLKFNGLPVFAGTAYGAGVFRK